MDAYGLHLMLNYVPLAVTAIGVAMLAIGLWKASETTKKIGLLVLITAAVVILPVYVTGEITGAAYPVAAAKELVGRHRSSALPAFLLTAVSGIAAVFAVIFATRRPDWRKWLLIVALLAGVLALLFLARTVLAGRQIKFGGVQTRLDRVERSTEVTNQKSERGNKLWLA